VLGGINGTERLLPRCTIITPEALIFTLGLTLKALASVMSSWDLTTVCEWFIAAGRSVFGGSNSPDYG